VSFAFALIYKGHQHSNRTRMVQLSRQVAGVDRFKENLSNFGKVVYGHPPPHDTLMVLCVFSCETSRNDSRAGRASHIRIHLFFSISCRQDVKVQVTGWEELGEYSVKVSWKFSCILELPWKPILAAAGALDMCLARKSVTLLNCKVAVYVKRLRQVPNRRCCS
jgi:hypothetical protein